MSLSRRRVLALLILTTILLITFDLRGNSVIDRSRETFGTVMDPFQQVGRFVTKPFVNAWHGVADYGDVKKRERSPPRPDRSAEGRRPGSEHDHP